MKKIPPHLLLDAILQVQGVKNDAHMAKDLRINASVLSKMRSSGSCSNDFRVAVMRTYGWSLSGIDKMAPPAAKA